MKEGQKLVAINTFFDVLERKESLTIGKEYEVTRVRLMSFSLIGDHNNILDFTFNELETYFQSITPESLEELGFEKTISIDDANFYEWVHVKGWISLMVDSDFKVHLHTKGGYSQLPNCRNLTDLKHLIRILGV